MGEYRSYKTLVSRSFTAEDFAFLAQHAADKYLLLKDCENGKGLGDSLDYYDPVVSTLRAAEHYLEVINRPLAHTNPSVSLINDLFETIFRKIAGFTKMLTLGLYPDAFVSWRTLHESECIVALLINGGDKVRYSYVKHIAYNNAYRNQSYFSKEQLDQAFEVIKGEMKAHDLKSKDMKKFIEYGWLYDHPLYDPRDLTFKLNFRDGIERLAHLSQYSKIYEGASEIAHSSSAFFYVNDAFCKDLSLAMVYQSFLRIGDNYLTFMKDYFATHEEEKKKALAWIADCRTISGYLDKKVGNIEVMESDDEENE
jgi:AraC-like DNA-binding protein